VGSGCKVCRSQHEASFLEVRDVVSAKTGTQRDSVVLE